MEMEKSTYWMWSRRKFSGSPLYNSLITPSVAASSTYHQSWEEQAFAEDSADHLGGCVWPPRSYTCSYCRREFRSAQALGGHMNVHRRDRARLKQSTPSSASDSHNRDDVNLNRLSTQIQYPHQVSTLLYNHNPNLGVNPSTISHPRVSSNMVEPKKTLITASQSITDLIPNRLELKLGRENWIQREVDCRGTINHSENQEESPINRKRRRVDEETIRSDVLKFKPLHIQELDLELRLGDAPKVK